MTDYKYKYLKYKKKYLDLINEGGAKKTPDSKKSSKPKKAAKAKRKEEARKAAEAKRIEKARKAAEAEAKRIEEARKAAEAEAKRIEEARKTAEAKRIVEARKAAEEKIYQDFEESLKESEKKIEKDMLEIQAKTKAKKRSKKAKKRRKKGVYVEDDPNILTQEILSINYKKFLDDLEIEELANSKKELEQREKNVKDLELHIERTEALERKRNIRNILSKKSKSFIDEYKDIKKNIEKNKQQINNNKVALNNLIDNKLVDVIRLMENLIEKNICEDFVYLLTEMIEIEIKKIKLELEEDYLENKSKIQEYELKIYNILKGNKEEINKFPEFKFKFKDWTEIINSKDWNKLINLIDSFVLILYLFLEVIDYHNKILESELVDNKIQLF